jgi:hypothetical protein
MEEEKKERPDIKTRFQIGNKDAEKWTVENAYDLFEEMFLNSEEDNNILCFNDACKSVEFRHSHIEYIIKKFPVFEDYKKDIQETIISRINKEALTNNFNSTASIWRMKQLGERDNKEVDVYDKRKTLSNEEREDRIKELKLKLGMNED